MSWSLYAKGSPKRVAAVINNQARYGCPTAEDGAIIDKDLTPDQRQRRNTASLILFELERFQFDNGLPNVAVVNASGSLHNGVGNLRIEISQDTVLLDEVVAVPVAAAPIAKVDDAAGPIVITGDAYRQPSEPTSCPDCGGLEHSRGCPRFV